MSDESPHRVEIAPVKDDLRRFKVIGWYGEAGASFDPAAGGVCEECEAEDRRREALMEAHMPTHEASSDCCCGVPCYSQRGYMLHLYEVIENDVREQ